VPPVGRRFGHVQSSYGVKAMPACVPEVGVTHQVSFIR
jgi:hypothetical protein